MHAIEIIKAGPPEKENRKYFGGPGRKKVEYQFSRRKMSEKTALIADPLISASGRIYSARGISELLAALFPECVDVPGHNCSRKKRRRVNYGKDNSRSRRP